MDRQKVSRSLNSCFSLFTLTIPPEQALPVLSCQQQNGGGGLGTEVSTYVASLLKLQILKVPGRSNLVLEPDPRKIGKEGLVNGAGWKCTLRNVRNFINC